MKSETYTKVLKSRICSGGNETNILKLIIGELQRLPEKDPEEDKVKSVIKKILKSSEETLRNLRDSSLTDVEAENSLVDEIVTLKKYLPQQLSEEELRKIITNYKNIREFNLGQVMKALAANYAGQYDGKLASEIYKEI